MAKLKYEVSLSPGGPAVVEIEDSGDADQNKALAVEAFNKLAGVLETDNQHGVRLIEEPDAEPVAPPVEPAPEVAPAVELAAHPRFEPVKPKKNK